MIFYNIIDTIELQTNVPPGKKGVAAMQNIESLKTHIIEQVEHSQDEALLDLILKLLIFENGELQVTA